jgi:hypothetical protein
MSTPRSATHTIAGYHYQFDKSMIEILGSKNEDPIILEGIEDIDLESELIQCKYHSSQKYTPSKIKPPLLAFVTHFIQSRETTIYTLYAHFREGSLPASLSIEEFKSIVGTALDDLVIDDEVLEKFVTDCLRIVPAGDFETQREQAIESICCALNCENDEAIEYYYGNALHEIMRLSRQPDETHRITTRAAFIAKINRKARLYSIWTQQIAGEREYHTFVRKELQSHDALSASKRKMFYLNSSVVNNSGVAGVATLCEFLVNRFFRIGYSLMASVPPTVVLEASTDVVLSLKRKLLEKKIVFNDGFEHIDFQPWSFDEDPVLNRVPTRNGRATDKINAASYHIRLLSRECYQRAVAQLRPSDVVFVLGTESDSLVMADNHDVIHLHAVSSYEMLISILSPTRVK